MKLTLTLLTALLFAPLAVLHAADPNEKILANGSIQIRFSSSSGAIVGLRNLERNLEFIAEPKLAQGAIPGTHN